MCQQILFHNRWYDQGSIPRRLRNYKPSKVDVSAEFGEKRLHKK
jgi:hypothetical protein